MHVSKPSKVKYTAVDKMAKLCDIGFTFGV